MQQTVLVTNQLATGSAFGLTDNMENVFIPSKLTVEHAVQPGERVKALIVPNTIRPDRTPWLAVKIIEDKQPAPIADDELADQIREDLEQGPATAMQIARSIDQPVDLVARKLREMKLVQDTIYALSFADLIEED